MLRAVRYLTMEIRWRLVINSGNVEDVTVAIYAEFLVQPTYATDKLGMPLLTEFLSKRLAGWLHDHPFVAVFQASHAVMTARDYECAFLRYCQATHP